MVSCFDLGTATAAAIVGVAPLVVAEVMTAADWAQMDWWFEVGAD